MKFTVSLDFHHPRRINGLGAVHLEAGHLDPGAFHNIENYIDLAVLPVDAGRDGGMVKALGAVKKFDLVDVGFQVFLIEGNFLRLPRDYFLDGNQGGQGHAHLLFDVAGLDVAGPHYFKTAQGQAGGRRGGRSGAFVNHRDVGQDRLRVRRLLRRRLPADGRRGRRGGRGCCFCLGPKRRRTYPQKQQPGQNAGQNPPNGRRTGIFQVLSRLAWKILVMLQAPSPHKPAASNPLGNFR